MKKNHKLLLGLVVFVFLLVIYYFFRPNPPEITVGPMRNISSGNLQFKAVLRGDMAFAVAESATFYKLTSGDISLLVSRNATNQGNLELYLEESDGRKKTLSVTEESTLDSGEGVWRVRTENYSADSSKVRACYLWTHNWVYSISTSSPELYDELEQIAKSFKYTGN